MDNAGIMSRLKAVRYLRTDFRRDPGREGPLRKLRLKGVTADVFHRDERR